MKLVEPMVHALDALLSADRIKMFTSRLDLGVGDADEIKSTARAQHGEPLLRHGFQAHEVEDVIGAARQQARTASTGSALVESIISVAPNRLAASSRFGWRSITAIRDAPAMRAPLTALSPTPRRRRSRPCRRRARSGIQDGAGAGYNAAAQQRSLRERNVFGHDGELVLVDERAFGEAAESQALEQCGAVAAQAGRIPGRRSVDSGWRHWKERPDWHRAHDPHDCTSEPTT